jgi:hypothetical protein
VVGGAAVARVAVGDGVCLFNSLPTHGLDSQVLLACRREDADSLCEWAQVRITF